MILSGISRRLSTRRRGDEQRSLDARARRSLLLSGILSALSMLPALATLTTTDARAEQATGAVPDPAAAALFHSGRELVEKGDWAAGCPKFEASLALYSSASTMLNIARCQEHDGKIASAWSTYKRALVVNRETPGEERRRALEDVAQKGIASLEPRLPKLRVVIAVAPEGLQVTRNGQYVPLAMLGTTIPVDPGEHRIVARAPGHRTEQRTVTVAEAKTERVEIALILGDDGGDPEAGDGRARSGGVVVPTWSLVVGAGGLALLTAGAAFRVDQALIEGRQHGICGGDVVQGCPTTYVPDADNARKNRDFGLFVGLGGAGVIALGAAIIGAVVENVPSSPKASAEPEVTARAWVGPGGFGASLGGRF
jgi:hypothetical protein